MINSLKTQIQSKKIYLLSVSFVALAFIYDIFIHMHDVPFIKVADSYCSIMLTVLCTVAVLGNAILSIVISTFSNKIYGFSIKELVTNLPFEIDIEKTTQVSFVCIIIAIVFFALNFATAISVITVLVITLIGNTDRLLWKLLTNSHYGEEIIKRKVNLGNVAPDYFLSRFFPELEVAIVNNDEAQQQVLITMIQDVVHSYKDTPSISSALEKRTADIFETSCFSIGFVDTIKKLIYLNDWKSEPLYDAWKMCFDYIGQIQYCDPLTLNQYHIVSSTNDIIDRMEVSEDSRIRCVLRFYHITEANNIIPNNVKDEILNSIINELSILHDNKNGVTRSKILLYIVRSDVLENEDINDRKKTFLMIIKNLHSLNKFNKEQSYISTIAQIFRALYFYIHYEVETLEEKYRMQLSLLFALEPSNKDNEKISLNLNYSRSKKIIIETGSGLRSCYFIC